MQHYVAGFMFDETLEHVALIKKNRPTWQAGLLNGIGGHVEHGETTIEAMTREFFEETGHPTFNRVWTKFTVLNGDGFTVNFYTAVGPVRDLKSTTDEPVEVFHVDCVDSDNAVPNITWLIPAARLALQGKSKLLTVREV